MLKYHDVVGHRNPLPLHSALLAWQIVFSALAIYLSLSESVLLWLLGQVLLAVNMLQWFFFIHDLGHGNLFKHPLVNTFFGHLASLFCLLPYYPWKKIHHAHHKWTGWREFDPTIPPMRFDELKPSQIRFIDFCWKYWIPVFAISYSAQTFFNLRALKRHFPDAKSVRLNAFSVWFVIVVYALLLLAFGLVFVKVWLLAFLLFVSISDPMLLSQHTHIDYQDIDKVPLKPVRFIDQQFFSRTVVYPKWAESYFLYNTNRHGVHHQYPWVPMFYLGRLPEPAENTIFWLDWLKVAKTLPGHLLIFRSYKHTGVKL